MCSSPGPVLRVRRTRFRSCHLLPFGMVGAAVSLLCGRGLRSCLLLPDRLRTAFFISPLLRSSRVSLGEWVGDWWGPGHYFCPLGILPPPPVPPECICSWGGSKWFYFFFPLVYEGSLSGFFFSTFLPECVGACFPYLPGPLPPLPRHCSPVCFFFFFPLPVFWLSPVRFSLVSPGLLALQLASDGPLAFSWIDVVPSNSLRAGA